MKNRLPVNKIRLGDTLEYLRRLPNDSVDLIVSSPPYNLGKEYEAKTSLDHYLAQQRTVPEEHRSASQSYMDEGIALMELATRAADLFEEQSASEKRRLLEFVLSNSIWASGELTPVFRQPFDMLADMATVGAQKMAAGEFSSSHHQEELPR